MKLICCLSIYSSPGVTPVSGALPPCVVPSPPRPHGSRPRVHDRTSAHMSLSTRGGHTASPRCPGQGGGPPRAQPAGRLTPNTPGGAVPSPPRSCGHRRGQSRGLKIWVRRLPRERGRASQPGPGSPAPGAPSSIPGEAGGGHDTPGLTRLESWGHSGEQGALGQGGLSGQKSVPVCHHLGQKKDRQFFPARPEVRFRKHGPKWRQPTWQKARQQAGEHCTGAP